MLCQNHLCKEEKDENSECDVDILCSRLTGRKTFSAKIKRCSRKGMYCESGEFMEKGTMIYYKIEDILKWISDPKAGGGIRTASLATVESCREITSDDGRFRYGTNVVYYISSLS